MLRYKCNNIIFNFSKNVVVDEMCLGKDKWPLIFYFYFTFLIEDVSCSFSIWCFLNNQSEISVQHPFVAKAQNLKTSSYLHIAATSKQKYTKNIQMDFLFFKCSSFSGWTQETKYQKQNVNQNAGEVCALTGQNRNHRINPPEALCWAE